MVIKNKNKNKTISVRIKDKERYIAVLNRFLLAAIIISGIYFVASVNDLSIKGFVLEDLRSKSRELKNRNELSRNRRSGQPA